MTLNSDVKFKKTWFVVSKWQEFSEFWSKHSSLKNLLFDWSTSCNVYNVWPKKVQRSYLSWHWGVMENLKKKNWLLVWKTRWGIWQIFTRALKSFKIGTFMRPNYPKKKMHELKIYVGYVLWQRRTMQNLKRNWLFTSKLKLGI